MEYVLYAGSCDVTVVLDGCGDVKVYVVVMYTTFCWGKGRLDWGYPE